MHEPLLVERVCPICKKRFIVASPADWVYKKEAVYFCSWGCMRKDEGKRNGGKGKNKS